MYRVINGWEAVASVENIVPPSRVHDCVMRHKLGKRHTLLLWDEAGHEPLSRKDKDDSQFETWSEGRFHKAWKLGVVSVVTHRKKDDPFASLMYVGELT